MSTSFVPQAPGKMSDYWPTEGVWAERKPKLLKKIPKMKRWRNGVGHSGRDEPETEHRTQTSELHFTDSLQFIDTIEVQLGCNLECHSFFIRACFRLLTLARKKSRGRSVVQLAHEEGPGRHARLEEGGAPPHLAHAEDGALQPLEQRADVRRFPRTKIQSISVGIQVEVK